jgi:CubicO group peptidase (beta-lactamase class C family)
VVEGVRIDGRVAPGFESVRQVFEENFRSRNEIGASVAVVVRNELVVDLWGGMASPREGRPWREDTLVNMFSTTKGMSALAVAHAHSRQLFDYDEKVSVYWPEFAAGGKADITVRTLLSHQAGLSAIDQPMDMMTLASADAVAEAIGRQQPAWVPGERHGYHGITLGWYESELIRRTDPLHRTMGRYFADEIAGPLGMDFHIGLPDEIPEERLARIMGDWYRSKMVLNIRTMPTEFVKNFLNPRTITARSFSNPKVLGMPLRYNDRDMRRIELPASNGTGTARSVAVAYGEFATGGIRLGIDPATLASLSHPATPPSSGRFDEVLRMDTTFSLGCCKPWPGFDFGSPNAFGTPGAGGSMGLADPELELGFCYAMNRMGFHLFDDPRERALREAARSAAKTHLGKL